MTRHASPLLTNHNHTVRRQGAWPWSLLSIVDQPLIAARRRLRTATLASIQLDSLARPGPGRRGGAIRVDALRRRRNPPGPPGR